jgi:alkylmercury lyase
MIEYLPGGEPAPDASAEVKFVGGPWNDEHVRLDQRTATIAAGGIYRRSVSCADDGALRYVWMPSAIPAFGADERLREAAFALLLAHDRPVTIAELADALGQGHETVGLIAARVEAAGWLDRDALGQITGSAGLSLTHGPHRLDIAGHRFRTWCAYDALGIAGALRADATIETTCPICELAIRVPMHAGHPARKRPERLWFANEGDDLRSDFCARTVLLCSSKHGRAWASQHDNQGRLLDLETATELGSKTWADCAAVVEAQRA